MWKLTNNTRMIGGRIDIQKYAIVEEICERERRKFSDLFREAFDDLIKKYQEMENEHATDIGSSAATIRKRENNKKRT